MRLVGAGRIHQYAERHAQAAGPLDRWRRVIEMTTFHSVPDLRRTFSRSYDYVPPRCHVFNIAGGHRLVALIDIEAELVMVDTILDHDRYARWRCL